MQFSWKAALQYLSGFSFECKPFPLHQDASIPQNCPDFVHCDLHLRQQPVVSSLYADVIFHAIVSEAGEEEPAIGPHIETQTAERLDNAATKCPASNWSQQS